MLRSTVFILSFITAATASAVTLTLDRAPEYALAHSPQLAAARVRIDEARGRVLGAGRLANPELEVEFVQNVRVPERSLGLTLMQRFPLTARLRLEKAVSRAQLAAAEAEVRDAERKLASEVRMEAVKLVAVRMQNALRQEQLTNSREQSEFILKRVAAGEASSIDAALLELETKQLEVELLQLKVQESTILGALRPLLGVGAREVVVIAGTLGTPEAPKWRTAENRPDLEAARHSADAARQAVQLAKAQMWQDLGVGLMGSGERMEDAPEGLTNDYFLGFRFSLALPLWNRNEGRIAEVKATAARAELEIEALTLTIRSEVETARSEMASLAGLVREMDQGLLPKAAQVEEQLRTWYGTGQTQLTEVLRARARRLELAQRRVDALRDYHLAKARYDAAVGRDVLQGKGGK